MPAEGLAADRARRWRWLGEPVDGAGLAVLRIAFGLLMALAMLRFWAKGWVGLFYHEPGHHFTYHGFGWLAPLPPGWMELLLALTGLAALALACGAATRLAALLFTLGFTWLELCDVSTYLNHYYLVSLLGCLFVVLPSGACWSLDARWRRRRGRPPPMVQGWHYALLRAQFGIVYLCAGLAKIHADWLLDGLPLGLWLPRFVDVPVLGPLFAQSWVAVAASWIGMLYDCSIPFLLCWWRTRFWGYLAVVLFHLATWLLFPIGMFPWIMIAGALIFFPPAWPRRWLGGANPNIDARTARRSPRFVMAVVVLFLLWQIAWPWRHLLHAGDVRWHEQGFRFAWRVMLMEKTGDLRYRLVDRDTGVVRVVDPACRLRPHQVKQLETQPDLILQFARHLAAEERRAGRRVAVHAEAWASLNGRPPRRLIDPAVDLARLPDGWDRHRYVVPFTSRAGSTRRLPLAGDRSVQRPACPESGGGFTEP